MLPVSGKKIFSSRWWALVFAAGICWTAVDIAGDAPKNDQEANDSAADSAALANILGNF